jgi:hypothetical protein
MKNLGMISAFAVLLIALLSLASRPNAEAQGLVKWEYAELTAVYNSSGGESFSWGDPTKFAKASSVSALSTKLGVSLKSDSLNSILNSMGSQGWELVSTTASAVIGSTGVQRDNYSWSLKRRR